MTVIMASAGHLIEACFVGLGRMGGGVMAATLAAGGCRVIAAVGAWALCLRWH
jgi:hypothetical protein